MPNDPRTSELLDLTRGFKGAVQTAELFGEEEFAASGFEAETLEPAAPVAAAPISTPAKRLVVPAAVPVQTPSPERTVLSNGSSSADKEARLQKLYAQYDGCRMCALAEGRTKIVFGVGVTDLKVLFVGEGPGFDEDKQGFPFVGKAGQLLDKILNSIGLDRSKNVYIANIVKCHPLKDPSRPEMRGNDRPPLPGEILACKEILDQQMDILDPPIICALGSTAARALMNSSQGITSVRGKLFDYTLPKSGKVIPLLPTYHPAALLRNELLKKDVWQDMKLLKTLLK